MNPLTLFTFANYLMVSGEVPSSVVAVPTPSLSVPAISRRASARLLYKKPELKSTGNLVSHTYKSISASKAIEPVPVPAIVCPSAPGPGLLLCLPLSLLLGFPPFGVEFPFVVAPLLA